MIPLFRAKLNQVSIDNVNRVLHSGWLGQGKEVALFEKEFCDYIGCKYAVALNSATAGLHLGVKLLNLPKEGFVITTPNTFISSNHALLYEGLVPVFADIDYNMGSISYSSVCSLMEQKFISNRVCAIMLVHYAGNPLEMHLYKGLAEKYGIEIIEDCAHAAGAYYDGFRIGANSKIAIFSFHGVKNIPMGDGGMLVTNEPYIYERAKSLRWLGINKSTIERSQEGLYKWEYFCDEVGYKYNMDDIHAAIGRGQLLSVDEDNFFRGINKFSYKHQLVEMGVNSNDFRLIDDGPGRSSNHMVVGLAKDSDTRRSILDSLYSSEIEYGLHYKPNYLYPMYKSFIKDRDCTGMENFYSRAITLPNHLDLNVNSIGKIVEAIKFGILRKYF